jgi:hypothetical protein
MKRLVSLFLCLSLSIFTMPRVMKADYAPDAKTLLDDANKALAAMIKAARADQGLDPKTPKNKPFWRSTQLIAKNLKMAKTGLSAKSDDFFKGIANARKAEEQLKVDWKLTDSKNKEVIENGKKLGRTIALLRTDFSKAAAQKSTPIGPSEPGYTRAGTAYRPAAPPMQSPEPGYTRAGGQYIVRPKPPKPLRTSRPPKP